MYTIEDYFQKMMDIAYSDVTDYLEFGQEETLVMSMYGPIKIENSNGDKELLKEKKNFVRLRESCEVDGTLIQEVKQGKEGVSVKPVSYTHLDHYITKDEILELLKKYENYTPVLIGCVDNNKTRILLEKTFKQLDECVYIDSANSEYEGDVYVVVKDGQKIVGKLRGDAYKFDLDKHPTEKSCEAQAAAGNIQYMVTNLKMANVVIEHISALLHGEIKVGAVSYTHLADIKALHEEQEWRERKEDEDNS